MWYDRVQILKINYIKVYLTLKIKRVLKIIRKFSFLGTGTAIFVKKRTLDDDHVNLAKKAGKHDGSS